MKRSFVFTIVMSYFLLCLSLFEQKITSKDLVLKADFVQVNGLDKHGTLHLNYKNESEKTMYLWLPRWSFLAFKTNDPFTNIKPSNNFTVNYLYLGFGDSTVSIYGQFMVTGFHIVFENYTGSQSVIKKLEPQQEFDIHISTRDTTSIKLLHKPYYNLCLIMKVLIDDKLNDTLITPKKVFYPFDNYYLDDVSFMRSDDFIAYTMHVGKNTENDKDFPLSDYSWQYVNSGYIEIKRK